jgi:translation initiation factor 5B
MTYQNNSDCFSWEDLLDDSLIDYLLPAEEHPVEEYTKLTLQKPNDIIIEETKPKQLKIPICVVLGQVDSGKTSFLDALRGTKIQSKEEGKITQIIDGTNILKSEIQYYFKQFKTKKEFNITIPGILLIDTPGHESFVSLRKLGANLCDIAIIIVDIVKGPQMQTIESINMLEENEIPYIIALNKVDTVYKWKSTTNCPFTISKKNQSENTLNHFDKLIKQNFLQFANAGTNAKIYTKLKNFKEWHPMVPISAKTKEGFSDLIAVLVKMSEKFLGHIDSKEEAKGIVIEKYMDIQGIGSAIDIILTHGRLNVCDVIYVQGSSLPIKIKKITTYNHITNKIEHLKQVNASFSCTLYGTNIQDIVSGAYFSSNENNEEVDSMTKKEIDDQVITSTKDIKEKGIFIQADSVGSLLALSYILKQNNIPVKNYGIGLIKQKNLLYVQQLCRPKIILAFNAFTDNNCDPNLVKELTIYSEKVVFKLIDRYNEFIEDYKENIKKSLLSTKQSVVWPCILNIEKDCIFRQKNPLIFAVKVKKGTLHLGTKLSTFNYKIMVQGSTNSTEKKERIEVNIGKVTNIRDTFDKDIEKAIKGQVVVIKVEGESNISFGRQLEEKNTLYSRISRDSINIMKEHFRDEIDKECVALLIKLKKIFIIN